MVALVGSLIMSLHWRIHMAMTLLDKTVLENFRCECTRNLGCQILEPSDDTDDDEA